MSVVVPTKNRPKDLINFLKSLSNQSNFPAELIIVDQSDDLSHIEICKSLIPSDINLIYIHNKDISGLVEAKYSGYLHSNYNVICFLEDDLILDSEFINNLYLGFLDNPNMIGCSGLITNSPNNSFFYNFFYNLFHLGIFYDPRFNLKRNTDLKFIPCYILSGGITAWRRSVFDLVPFDLKNKFFMLEDYDYCSRVNKVKLGDCYINTLARVTHLYSPINRPQENIRLMTKTKEYVLFYRTRKSWDFAFMSFLWLLIGLFAESFLKSIKSLSTNPIVMFFIGIKEGFKQNITVIEKS
ncbi:glycosyltransferase family 2 protein [Polynucleobacter bastaniensis]|uniref:glycosyltransferase family 2 protein n=1 Tax=Polynucleobacter bastaniensis TaxID=2081039 RepID=UPI001C0AAE4B|nr:glycosyltransferase family 2 protein [Polynucleobacter bastaniensis]